MATVFGISKKINACFFLLSKKFLFLAWNEQAVMHEMIQVPPKLSLADLVEMYELYNVMYFYGTFGHCINRA